jgi:N-glycosylase/DNA lyase
MTFSIRVPQNFNLRSTITSHGWCALAPFSADRDLGTLRFPLRLNGGKPLSIDVSQKPFAPVVVKAESTLAPSAQKTVTQLLRSMLRLEEDYAEFYVESKRYPHYRWVSKAGAGRLLRAQTVFEDVLKMMCTTNCSWALTQVMVEHLCRSFGEEADDGRHAFPTPDAIADSSEKFIRKEIRAGYRSPYILELARNVAKRKIDPETWRRSALPTEQLYEEVSSIKGIGPYAAGNILKLLGRYDYLGIDSWCRKKFFELHTGGRKRTDKFIERRFEPLGKWRGLFFWLDVTREWYNGQKAAWN